MASFPFTGSGEPTEVFRINGALISKPLLPGELRLREAFPYPTLEMWRRTALSYTAATPTTGTSDLATRGRTTLLFAHEADLSSIFFDLMGTSAVFIEGYYNDKLRAQEVAKTFETALVSQRTALLELAQQKTPSQYLELLEVRLSSATFNHRVAGLCAAVYLSSNLLNEEVA